MNTPTKTLIAALVIALTAGGSAAFAVSAVTGGSALSAGDALDGCLDPSAGTLALSAAGAACAGGTVPVTWHAAGDADQGGAESSPSEPVGEAAGKPDEAEGTEAADAGSEDAATPAAGQRETGAAGMSGRDGDDGAPGAAGANGAPGRDGAPGTDGPSGPQGERGESGEAGTAGERGQQGLQGDTGERGLQGERGERGADGSVPWTAIAEWSPSSTYTAGPPASLVSYQGSSYVAARSSLGAVPSASPSDWIVIATAGAQGEKGEKGDDGEQGIQGVPGVDGAPGAQGLPGAPGEQGLQGIQGVAGVAGLDGQNGRDGETPWQFLGEYDAADLYTGAAPASVVQYQGSSWVAVRPTAFSGIAPGTDATAWSLLAAAGSPGAPGAQGATGPAGPTGPQGVPGPEGDSALSALFGQATGVASPGMGVGDCVIGELSLTAANRTDGLPANGQVLPIQPYQALYALIGVKFGGDGTTTFRLPDLRAVAPNNTSYFICTEGVFPTYL